MKLVERKDLDDGYSCVCRVYGNNKHYVKRSVRCGSWFEESRLSLIHILELTYLWVKGTRCEWITDELGISKNTVTDWMNFCRDVCVEAVLCSVQESRKLKMKSSTIADACNGHSLAGGNKYAERGWPVTSQRFSIGSEEYSNNSIQETSSLFKYSLIMLA